MNDNFMKTKPVLPLLLSLALPMMLSMLVNSLYNIIDSFFVAKISEDAMTALSLVFPIQNFINAVAIGFGIGINAVVAYFLGAGDNRRANQATTLGVILAIVHGILLTVGSILFIPYFLKMFSHSENVISLGIEYSNIVFAFSLIIMLNVGFEKIFQSVGKMKVTMFSMMAGSITNIILDPILIFGIGPFPRMEIKGAAIATSASILISMSVSLYHFIKGKATIKVKKENLKMKFSKPYHICTFSRVMKEKGIENIVNVVKKINKKEVLYTLDIYGPVDNKYRDDFEKLQNSFPNYIKYKVCID